MTHSIETLQDYTIGALNLTVALGVRYRGKTSFNVEFFKEHNKGTAFELAIVIYNYPM